MKHEHLTKNHTMKKLTIIGLLVVIVAVCLLLHRQHVESVARFDSEFRQQLAGVWLRQEAGMRCTNTVAADGSFVEVSWFIHPDRTNTYQRTGTWIFKDGRLVETIKSSTNPSEVTPHTNVEQVVRSNAGELVISWQASTNKTVWQRVSP